MMFPLMQQMQTVCWSSRRDEDVLLERGPTATVTSAERAAHLCPAAACQPCSRSPWSCLTKPLFFSPSFFPNASMDSSQCPTPKLAVSAGVSRARAVHVTGRCRGETEDGRLGPGCRDSPDCQPDVHLSRGALRKPRSSGLEGGRTAEDHELQRLLSGLPHGRQELPQGSLSDPESRFLSFIVVLLQRKSPNLKLDRSSLIFIFKLSKFPAFVNNYQLVSEADQFFKRNA